MHRSPRRLAPALLVAGLVAAGLVASAPASRPAAAAAGLRIVFAATDLDATTADAAMQAIYTADGDGGNVRRITPVDGLWYDWPMWAMNGTKIVYTAASSLDATAEAGIYLMDPDGSNATKLSRNPWKNIQPKISPDGRSLIFTSIWDEFPQVAQYRLSLATLQVENLSARTFSFGALDADPKWSPDGTQILFASALDDDGKDQPTQVYAMHPDGAGRRKLTNDRWHDVDPSLSPDGRYVAYASYRGEGLPGVIRNGDQYEVKQGDWHLVVKEVATGAERVFTQGMNCTDRQAEAPCSPTEGAGWQPQWSPDGKRIAYLAVRGPAAHGLYVMDADGSNAHPLIETSNRGIAWFDWTEAGPPPTEAVRSIGQSVPSSRLLFGARVQEKGKTEYSPTPRLFSSTPDRWLASEVPLSNGGLAPELARWTPDRSSIVFTARAPVDRSTPPPAPPPGLERREHYRLPDPPGEEQTPPPRGIADEQVYLMAADGSNVRQLTTPKMEDYLEAIPDEEFHGNGDPDISPDGRYLVCTNRSEQTGESWLLRKDLQTGEVLNLSTMSLSPGAPGMDEKPRFAPDGSRIAFMSGDADTTQISVMSRDGDGVRQLTNDGYLNVDPAWSPDGRWLVYSSFRGALPEAPADDAGGAAAPQAPARMEDWYLVKVSVETGEQVQLTTAKEVPAVRPVWSPDGSAIAFISFGGKRGADIWVVDADGQSMRPLQVTLRSQETFLDWR